MTENHDLSYPPENNDALVSDRRYDTQERLIAWTVRQDDHFLLFRVEAFREVILEGGEKLDVPETIRCTFSDCDAEPASAECTISHDTPGKPAPDCDTWACAEFDTDAQLQCNHARWFDKTQGRWLVSDEPNDHDSRNDDFYPYPQ